MHNLLTGRNFDQTSTELRWPVNQMADDSFVSFDLFDNILTTSEHVTLARANPFDDYNEKKSEELREKCCL